MKKSVFLFAMLCSSLGAAIGCSGGDDVAWQGDDTAEEEIKLSPRERQAVQAFLADPDIAASLGTKRHAAPEVYLKNQGSFGRPISTFLVVTFVDDTLPGMKNATKTVTVAGEVHFGPAQMAPSVTQVTFAEASSETTST